MKRENQKNCDELNALDLDKEKRLFANKIISDGENLLAEIVIKESIKSQKKREYIELIIKKTKNKYTYPELNQYDYDTILELFHEIKNRRKNKIIRILQFLFNN